MEVRRTSLVEGARAATGTAVIIDVFRAFTTAAFCVAAGATEVVLVADHAQALGMRAADPTVFLTGEIRGRPIQGFDAGNNPSVIQHLDLSGRRVVQRTSSGTQCVVAATGARRIVLGSLVIAGATLRHVRAVADEVTLVAASTTDPVDADEDLACAVYLERQLLGGTAPAPAVRLLGDEEGWPDWFPREDAILALQLDRFDFALPVTREDGLLVARPLFF
ncbi:MAG TPA: 2-phosphosulfolactate phosphatase [Candidatus Limnocylindria bacterium]|nr:2-phosphosulfolactate phosphatase [Candidatus Limnocylindria bacterium]